MIDTHDDCIGDLIKMYVQKFGGFPYFLFMGASDESIKEAILESLKTGKEISAGSGYTDK